MNQLVNNIQYVIDSILDTHDLFNEGFIHSYWNPNRGLDDSKSNYFYIRQVERQVNPTYSFSSDVDSNAYTIGAEYYLVADVRNVEMKRAVEILVAHLEMCYPGIGVLGVDDDPWFIFNSETQFVIPGGGLLTHYLPLIRIRFEMFEPFNNNCREILCKDCLQ